MPQIRPHDALPHGRLGPVAAGERIVALDVVRGFALLGIFLMNVEFFSRPLADLDAGLPVAAATGLDYWAGWLVHVLVRGKFWTMFSLLFGMGFAVMLTRAERAGAAFTAPYLRRTLALGVIGALHYLFLWAGDILFSYALGAALLMIVFHARPRPLFLFAGACAALAAGCALAAKLGLGAPPWQLFLALGVPVLVLAIVAAVLRRWPLSGLRHAGLALYLLPFLAMAVGGAAMLQAPPETRAPATAQAAQDTPAAKAQAERAQRLREHAARIATEARVMSQGSYAEAVALRAGEFGRQAGTDAAFAMIVLGMFLLGAWFVRSGIMLDPAAHLPLFRRLAWFGIPVGVGIGVLAAGIATSHVRGRNDAAFQLATGLAMLGNLPASLGYVAAVVLAFHGRWRRWVAALAPAGRMALSNYLLQSLLGTWFFYGYGLGHWGMGRAGQLLFVVVVFALQLLLSHWWLARFRYGPLEWLWRGVTYLRWPRLRQPRIGQAA
ncbi:DUF418 domain-containing protein [Cognatiluteimonas weifangensis]|uniref:DUF418 domain-containing protein n=1 Tax=Cognatiluteimonas weifangensis TaxID=2303539 RepID=A0A372DIQ5_9GAMM|nr:DUF418 domain-containing protein [Luteimonas weifangensis]RFP59455.1 DUF418 domain-containing protein [Luteimonas weifangensis]